MLAIQSQYHIQKVGLLQGQLGGGLSHLAYATPSESASGYWPCIYLSLPHTPISSVLCSWAKHHPTWNSAESSEGPVACWESQTILAGATAHDGSRPYGARHRCGPERKYHTIHCQTLPWAKETPHDNDDGWFGLMTELKSRERIWSNYQHWEVLRGQKWNNYDLWTGTSLKINPQNHM